MISLTIIDAAIKVALGMITSGLFFLWYVKSQGSLDFKEREDVQQRRVLLQQVAQKVGNVHHVYQQYLALVMELTRYGNNWPESRRRELTKVTQELVDVFKELTEAESSLLLLGEKKLERALRVYGAKIVYIRKMVYAERREFTGEELAGIEENKREISVLKETFFDALSDRFLPMKKAIS